MLYRKLITIVCSITVLVLVASGSPKADVISHMTSLTFSQPVSLPGVTLGAGTYVFELANPVYNPDIVRVLNANRTQIYYLGFTQLIERPQTTGHNVRVAIGEARAGDIPQVL